MAASGRSSQKASSTFEVVSKSVEETQRLGEQLGACLAAGDVVGLTGELGSGKTTFIQGLAKGLGIEPGLVRSPTFILMREYPGRVPLIHVDGYRLDDAASVSWLDVDWVFSPKKVTVIEWADRCQDALPEAYLELRFQHVSTNQRRLRASGHGPRSNELVSMLSHTIHDSRSTNPEPHESPRH
ncbi:MAG: tRNA (adenosine(37)-N6)-threonylcarbamoyltransferase complex ATPase subunit type 1 TsaE [Candidatus Omnitrophica bacterium]|nr:tRNA (adenosine(37)-N6)-threonylcarbamoyltransferase complex ATPase subunit type 1 TsaE [Candidatus Omnitrophota bacterium]